MSKITNFFKPLEGGARPAQAPPSADELAGARRKAFHARFVSHTNADPTKKPVGRTPNAVIALYALHNKMWTAYGAYTGSLSLDEWWAEQPELAALPAAAPAAAAAVAAAAPGAVGEAGAGAPSGVDVMEQQEYKKHGYRSPFIRVLYQVEMHVWAQDGTHMSFRSAADFSARVLAYLGHGPLASSTAGDWLKREKDAYGVQNVGVPPHKHALLKRPDVPRLMGELLADRAAVAQMGVPPNDPGGHGARMAAWYPELTAAVTPLTALPGFGPYMVCGVAASLFAKKTDGEEWTPSEEWARHFMTQHMKLVVRRVTGHMTHPAAVEKQLQLHDINLNIVSLAMADDGLQPCDIYFMDEFGAFLPL